MTLETSNKQIYQIKLTSTEKEILRKAADIIENISYLQRQHKIDMLYIKNYIINTEPEPVEIDLDDVSVLLFDLSEKNNILEG